MNLQCSACRKRFRSAIAEARHRHNFPVLCTRNKHFARWVEEIETERAKERVAAFRARYPAIAAEWEDVLKRAERKMS